MKVVIAHGGNIGFQGGGTLRVLTFAKSLAERGYDVSLVVPNLWETFLKMSGSPLGYTQSQ